MGIPDSTPGITENEIPMVLVGMPTIQPFMPDKSLGNYTDELRVEVPYTYSLGAEALLKNIRCLPLTLEQKGNPVLYKLLNPSSFNIRYRKALRVATGSGCNALLAWLSPP